MTSSTQYVDLDGKTHVLAEGGVRTVCYRAVPYATDWTTDEPEKLCAECAKKTKDDDAA